MSTTDKTISNIPAERVVDSSLNPLFDPAGGYIPIQTTDNSASNNSIYYSTDQSAICYKDPSGNIHIFDMTGVP